MHELQVMNCSLKYNSVKLSVILWAWTIKRSLLSVIVISWNKSISCIPILLGYLKPFVDNNIQYFKKKADFFYLFLLAKWEDIDHLVYGWWDPYNVNISCMFQWTLNPRLVEMHCELYSPGLKGKILAKGQLLGYVQG